MSQERLENPTWKMSWNKQSWAAVGIVAKITPESLFKERSVKYHRRHLLFCCQQNWLLSVPWAIATAASLGHWKLPPLPLLPPVVSPPPLHSESPAASIGFDVSASDWPSLGWVHTVCEPALCAFIMEGGLCLPPGSYYGEFPKHRDLEARQSKNDKCQSSITAFIFL